MRYRIAFFIWLLIPAAGLAAEVSVAADGTLIVDGERRFVFGMYEASKDDAAASELAEAGFNLVHCSNQTESLDRAKKYGLGAWVNLGGKVRVREDSGAERLKAAVEPLKNHPALWVWEVPDEALWNLWYGKLLQANKRWEALHEKVAESQLQGDKKSALDRAYQRFQTYRQSARYRLAEDEEETILEMLGLPVEIQPRLGEWYDEVEPLRQQMERGCRVVREVDGRRPIWFNHAPRNTIEDLKKFGTIADIAGCDIYPVPFGRRNGHSDLGNRELSSIGAYTRRMAAGAPGKAVWMVLQGFSWADIHENAKPEDNPRPTYEQTRYMALDAIANGARGILYWGTAYVEKDSEFWGDLKRCVRELAELEPYLAAPDAGLPLGVERAPTAASCELEIKTICRRIGERYCIILVNENRNPLAFTLTGLDRLEDKTFKVDRNWESFVVKKGKIELGLPAMGALVMISE